MYSSVQREVPEFLQPSLILFCDNLVLSRNEKTCFILTRNLQFFEFKRKQLLRSIDLGKKTVMTRFKEKLQVFEGPKGKYHESNGGATNQEANFCGGKSPKAGPMHLEPSQRKLSALSNKATANFSKNSSYQAPDISLGKYIYCNLEIFKVYILIQCWNTLIVLEREMQSRSCYEGFRVVTEFEQVLTYKLVSDCDLAYQAFVRIRFTNGSTTNTNFQNANFEEIDDPTTLRQQNRSCVDIDSKVELKQLLQASRSAKAELQAHKSATQKSFSSLHQTLVFGHNIARSLKAEDKPILTRCGDVWLRLNGFDELIVGVPLLNNCAIPNGTIVKNLKPIFKRQANEGCSEAVEDDVIGLNYQHRFYQLKGSCPLNFSDNIIEAMKIDSNSTLSMDCYCSSDEVQLLPEAFGILLIKLKAYELIDGGKYQLSLSYETENQAAEVSSKIAELNGTPVAQQMSINGLDLNGILRSAHREKLLINFEPATLQRDVLSILVSHLEIKIGFNFATEKDRGSFEGFLKKYYDLYELFVAMERAKGQQTQHEAAASGSYRMDIDDDDTTINDFLPHKNYAAEGGESNGQRLLLFNNKPNSLWFSLVAFRESLRECDRHPKSAHNFLEHNEDVGSGLQSPNDNVPGSVVVRWTFYLPSESRSLMFVKHLFDDVILAKCNVDSISLFSMILNKKKADPRHIILTGIRPLAHLLSVESALRKETKQYLEYLGFNYARTDCKPHKASYESLIKLQYRTDLIVGQLKEIQADNKN